MTNSIVLQLQDPKVFDSFIQENMKLSTYVAEWKNEMPSPEYCAAKVYKAYLAEYGAAIVGSIIDKNGSKPIHQLPVASELVGTIGRMADKWQLDNDRLEQFYYLEGRYNDKKSAYSAQMRETEFRKLVQFLFDPFEKAVIAPHKRIDMLYYEGLFNGTQTVNANNNSKGRVSYTYNLGVKSFETKVAKWGETTATPIDDIQQVIDFAESKGKTVQKIRMSKKTFRKMCKSTQLTDKFIMKLGKVDVKTQFLSLQDVNAYFEGLMLPTIQVEKDRWATLGDGNNTNLTKDDRVVLQCADTIAVLKLSDPLESIDKLPNKTYSTYDDNLVGFWRTEEGRFTDYDMWGTPVFTGKNEYFILKTDEVQ